MPSPVPMYLMGRPETANTLSAAPPLLSPSILVKMAPAQIRPGRGQAPDSRVWTSAQPSRHATWHSASCLAATAV